MALPLSKTSNWFQSNIEKACPHLNLAHSGFVQWLIFYLPLHFFPQLPNKFESALSLDHELYAPRCESQSVTCPITALKYHGNLTPQLHPRHLESWPARHGLRATQCDHQRYAGHPWHKTWARLLPKQQHLNWHKWEPPRSHLRATLEPPWSQPGKEPTLSADQRARGEHMRYCDPDTRRKVFWWITGNSKQELGLEIFQWYRREQLSTDLRSNLGYAYKPYA